MCGNPEDARLGLAGWGWGNQEVRLARGQILRITVSTFGSDRAVDLYVVDQNNVEILRRRMVGGDSSEFVAPYDDIYRIRVYNPTLLSRKTIDLHWQVCS